jgi:hypothetical protein
LHEARHRRGSIDQSVRQVEMTSVESNAPIWWQKQNIHNINIHKK